MKKLKCTTPFLALALFFTTAQGQTQKGKILLGGTSDISFNSSSIKSVTNGKKEDLGKTSQLTFSPQIGFFVANNFSLGLGLPLVHASEKYDEDHKLSYQSISLAPFFRYYFGETNVKPYLHSEVGVGSWKITSADPFFGSNKYSGGLRSFASGAGLGIFLNESVTLDLGLRYASESTKSKDAEDKDMTSGVNFLVGFVLIL
jgi:opacity protein-like surface antigen